MTGATPPPFVVVAANEMLAASIESRLRGLHRWRVVVGAPAQVGSLIDDHDPTVVLLSEPPNRLGRILDVIRRRPQPPPVILLLADPHGAWTPHARRASVRAVLRADATADELQAAITAVVNGLLVLHPDALRAASAVGRVATGDRRELTPRERDILAMMAEGLGNQMIAVRLGISRETVKFHVASILAKLGAASRTAAVMVAVRRGLVVL